MTSVIVPGEISGNLRRRSFEGLEMPKVAIIGGGITGLTAAYTLEKETDFEVTLIESGNALGGKIQTVQDGGFTVEAGPDSIFVGKPAAMELVNELGLQDEIVEPTASGFHLL